MFIRTFLIFVYFKAKQDSHREFTTLYLRYLKILYQFNSAQIFFSSKFTLDQEYSAQQLLNLKFAYFVGFIYQSLNFPNLLYFYYQPNIILSFILIL